jgi:23S rRNA (cytidine2498-2'-O)-methyltransferase
VWLWTSRPGFEPDLAMEISGRPAGPALVTTDAPRDPWPTFARTGFPVATELCPSSSSIAALAADLLAASRAPFSLRAWTPDADETNVHSALAADLESKSRAALLPDLLARHTTDLAALRYGGLLVEVCLLSPSRAFVGLVPAQDLPTLAPGGRARSKMPADSPSRAARKLVEALDWLGFGPEPGEACVDLGAAPGGWTCVLVDRGARVVAVDPAKLAPAFAKHRSVTHVQASAFDYLPPSPVDWLLCDMAWRPLEVAALLAKWARRRLARALVANVKLPMKDRVGFVRRISSIVAEGGWTNLRSRQLYHDREEFTLAAWRS